MAAELNLPLRKLDAVLSRIDAEIGMENRRLELRLERLAKTRQLLDQINDALTSLKHKPGNGQLLYDLIYLTYIAEDKMRQTDVLFRLNVSRRHYDDEYYEYEDILISGIPLKHALFFIIGLLTCISILVALQIASVRISEDDDFDDNDE